MRMPMLALLAAVLVLAPTLAQEIVPTDGTIRLVGGRHECEGRVEVYHDSQWGTVCDDEWDYLDAEVVCRELGFTSGISMGQMKFGAGSGPIWMDNVDCTGPEARLVDCDFSGWEIENCRHYEDASVICVNGTACERRIRLVGGLAHQGRVEVYHDNQWGTVCDDNWSHDDAAVVCSELGLSGGLPFKYAQFGEGCGIIWMTETMCRGSESILFDCAFRGWGNTICDHSEDAGVVCDPSSGISGYGLTESEGSIRLVGGSSSLEGRVEVYHDNQWGTVCRNSWDHADAAVVCTQLGFSGGFALEDLEFGGGSGNIWMNDVKCSGSESRLDDCEFAGWGRENCRHSQDVGVICEDTCGGSRENQTPYSDTIRLVSIGTGAGRVEIYHDGEWGTVCNDLRWGHSDARVVCKQLGFTGGRALWPNLFGAGEGRIWLRDVRCRGNEDRLEDCEHAEWGTDGCQSGRAGAPVACTVPSERTNDNGYIRLANGGSDTNSGRVEIYHDGQWGTVCEHYFGQEEADVVCKMLGHAFGLMVTADHYGRGRGPIWLDNVNCQGHESDIADCEHLPLGERTCTHYMDVGVQCY